MQSLRIAHLLVTLVAMASLASLNLAADLAVDDTPGQPGEWGFRPVEGESSPVTPPSFSWRPQKKAVTYELQASRDATFETVEYSCRGIEFNVHCPPEVFAAGEWSWRFRFVDGAGETSPWSCTRKVRIDDSATPFPLPSRAELLARLPAEHPRLFLRPQDVAALSRLAAGELEPLWRQLLSRCERLLREPPPAAEPPKYPADAKRLSERWREIWWGNRVYTIRVLESATTLAFTNLLGGDERYGELARDLLLAAAKWDPKGATGYRYNDEAGMPYAYWFSRAYTFLHHRLTDAERETCRQVMRVRGEEMYRHLQPRHLWKPYSSHSNRAWHFLGEIGIAFHGEIEAADDWVWFAMNVFANVYPVWSDADGGWHEGISYWRSYVGRFTWWADVMRAATGIDAYSKPYFSKAGYWPMYLQPPGTRAGGFGDLAFTKDARDNADLMRILAVQARNPHWQWYVESLGRPRRSATFVDFVRGAQGTVEAAPPVDLPTSRVFRGVGQAVLNSNLLDGTKNVSVLFKASPFGTQSHGFEAQNAFQLYAFGEPLLIRTGRRDIHGSEHHREWMWDSRSVNTILVDGGGQIEHSPKARARITRFRTGDRIDFVEGEAGEAYGDRLERFTRSIVFLKPDWIVIVDRLEAPRPATFQWLLHAPTPMEIDGQRSIAVRNGAAACRVGILAPSGLELSQTDEFDPPPRPRVKLRQFHLTASTTRPAARQTFVTAIRVHRHGLEPLPEPELRELEGGYAVRLGAGDTSAVVLVRTAGEGALKLDSLSSDASIAAFRVDSGGAVVERLERAEEGL